MYKKKEHTPPSARLDHLDRPNAFRIQGRATDPGLGPFSLLSFVTNLPVSIFYVTDRDLFALAELLSHGCEIRSLILECSKTTYLSSDALSAFCVSASHSSIDALVLDQFYCKDPDDVGPAVAAIASDPASALESLTIMRCSVKHPEGVMSAVECNRLLESLEVREVRDVSAGFKGVGQMLSRNTNLKKLVLIDCSLSAEEAEAIATALADSNRTLTHLDLARNSIGPLGTAKLAQVLTAHNNVLRRLNLSSNQIDDHGGNAICAALAHNHALTHVLLRSNRLHEAGQWTKSLAMNRTLVEVDLGMNDFSDEGAEQILTNCDRRITRLEAGGMNVTCHGAISIAMALAAKRLAKGVARVFDGARGKGRVEVDSTGDVTVDLSEQKMGDLGLSRLIPVLAKIPQIKHLRLCGNKIEYTGAKLIADSLLQPGSSLLELKLNENDLGDKGASTIASALSSPGSKLHSLYLGSNGINSAGGDAIAKMLETNRSLLVLRMKRNWLGHLFPEKLVNALQKNSTLRYIDVLQCDLGPKYVGTILRPILLGMAGAALRKIKFWCYYTQCETFEQIVTETKEKAQVESVTVVPGIGVLIRRHGLQE